MKAGPVPGRGDGEDRCEITAQVESLSFENEAGRWKEGNAKY